jgi:hypothetical protein
MKVDEGHATRPACSKIMSLNRPFRLFRTNLHFYPPEYQKLWLDYEDASKQPHFSGQAACFATTAVCWRMNI